MNKISSPFYSLVGIAALLSMISCTTFGDDSQSQPNIIFIMADDMGYADLGCYENKMIQTPHLDKMAEEGIRFTQHYAGSTVCAPSRCSLMTGKHTGHAYIKGNFAMQTVGNLPIPESTVTVAELLKQTGYQTAVIGKWGLGGPGSVGSPNNQGFDYSYCFLDQRNAHEYYPPYLWENEEKVMLENKTNKKDYAHDLFTEKAINFIKKQNNKPFFLYLPYTIPHGKYQVPDDKPYSNKDWEQIQKNRAAMITRMDLDIGRILKLLKAERIDENTIVFFTSDNGAVSNQKLTDFFNSNANLRGYKRDLYEGGIRVPLIIRWPGKIKPGRVSDHISALWDFLPTACELAGTQSPEDINGISYLPELLGNDQTEHEYLYWEYFRYHYSWQPGDESPRNSFTSQAVRMDKWKGVRNNIDQNPDALVELYNLDTDEEEKNNVAEDHPQIVEKIKKIMLKAHQDTKYFQTDLLTTENLNL